MRRLARLSLMLLGIALVWLGWTAPSVAFLAVIAATILSATLFWHTTQADLRAARRSPWLTDLLEPVRLRELVQESLQRSGLTPRLHQGGDPHVSADRRALGRAFDRLLSHATEVHLTTAGPMAELLVSGVGQDEFGLWIVRKIVEAHGGEVRISGGEARVTLPLMSA